MGSYGGFGVKLRTIGVLRWFWGESVGNWGSERIWGETEGKRGPEVDLR